VGLVQDRVQWWAVILAVLKLGALLPKLILHYDCEVSELSGILCNFQTGLYGMTGSSFVFSSNRY